MATTKKKTSVKPKVVKPVPKEERKFTCTMCGEEYKKQEGNFPGSNSPLFANNNRRLPICSSCLDYLYFHYLDLLGDEEAAIRRVCMKFDYYFSHELFLLSFNSDMNHSLIRAYISRANLRQYCEKNFDVTLDEERETEELKAQEDTHESVKIVADRQSELETAETIEMPPDDVIEFWGYGLEPAQYKFLQHEYEDWLAKYDCVTKAQQELFKSICFAQLDIRDVRRTGTGKVADAYKSLQDLMGSANIKPKQNANASLVETNTFGTFIKMVENTEPILEPSDDFKDVDGIEKYISIYFLGHLCKILNIKNSYSRMYEDEMRKYRVEKPEYADDDEALFDAVFGGATSGSNSDNKD